MRFTLDGDLEVFFPYDYVYKEQYQYMLELKRALDAKGDAILEMPTGTGKTVSLLALITSYQYAHPECGKLVYCTRTVPEMVKTMEELKRVIDYRTKELAGEGGDSILAVCLSSRRNMCIHPDVMEESDRERVDAACRSRTASWVRARAERAAEAPAAAPVELCDFFEGYDATGTDADLRGIYNIDDLKELGRQRKWCPYFLARHVISYANVVVYNYQYMLDPKIASLISRELDDKSIIVFDEAHNIDNVCIEALSVTLDRKVLDGAVRNLNDLAADVKRMKAADASRLQEEYQRLVHGLNDGNAMGVLAGGAGGAGGGGGYRARRRAAAAAAAADGGGGGAADDGGAGLRGGEEVLAAPVLPADVLAEAVPGNIRNAELFLRFMKTVVQHLRKRIKVASVQAETPPQLLHGMATKLAIDIKPLKFAYARLSSLMRTLQVTDIDAFQPITLVADFVTLLATYPVGFMVILEPFNPRTPHVPDPLMQLACLDASLAIKPVFQKFQSVILTSGTLSPLDMYPKMLNFQPVVRASLEMSIVRPSICPMIVSRGGDQGPLTTKFEVRDDKSVTANYGKLLIQLAATVPDGIVAFFPSYAYMERIISEWEKLKVLEHLYGHKLLFFETKDIVETTLSLNNYKKACDAGRGAIFFSIARGKVAEGIDFDRHYGRAVVLFGIPFQYTLSHVLRARLVYLRDTFQIREQDFLTFDALRQSSQCVGRIIRSKRDYGIIVFADRRYASNDKRSKLPQWVLQFLPDAHVNVDTDHAIYLSRRFLKEMAQPPPPDTAVRGKTLLTKADLEAMSARAPALPTRPPVGVELATTLPRTGPGALDLARRSGGVHGFEVIDDAAGMEDESGYGGYPAPRRDEEDDALHAAMELNADERALAREAAAEEAREAAEARAAAAAAAATGGMGDDDDDEAALLAFAADEAAAGVNRAGAGGGAGGPDLPGAGGGGGAGSGGGAGGPGFLVNA